MITSAQLNEAAELVNTIEAEKAKINVLQGKLNALLAHATDGVTAPSPVEVGVDGRKKRGPLSPKAKRAIAKGQEERWAKFHAEKAKEEAAKTQTVPVQTTVTIPVTEAPVKAAATSEQVLATA